MATRAKERNQGTKRLDPRRHQERTGRMSAVSVQPLPVGGEEMTSLLAAKGRGGKREEKRCVKLCRTCVADCAKYPWLGTARKMPGSRGTQVAEIRREVL